MTTKQHNRGGVLGGIFGGFGGGIFGSISWLVRMAIVNKDWTTLTAVVIIAIILFIVCVKICFGKPSRTWLVAQWMVAALGILNLAVINLKWKTWIANPQTKSHLLSSGETLLKANMTIAAVFAAIIVLFFFLSKTCNKSLVEYELQQMQIKDL